MRNASRQRGAAVLAVTVLLLFVLALVVGFANRNLIFEHRASANQVRATQAFEAAEAGLEWAQAMLNGELAIGADCAPSEDPGATAFRRRFLDYDAASQGFTPRTWSAGGVAAALLAACVLDDGAWSCSCPSTGHPTLVAPPATGAHPAFALRFVAVARSGMVQVIATGCDHFAPACQPGLAGPATGGARAQVQVTLALLPALATLPVAALTARGNIAADGALALANTDPAGSGLTAQAGGSIAIPVASLVTKPGSLAPASLAAHDSALAGSDAERLLTRLLGLDRSRWQQLPGVRSVTCLEDCTAELALTAPHRILWIASDLELDGPLTLGAAEQPLLLVVEGQIRLRGGVQIHGAIVSLTENWDTSGTSDAAVHGAVLVLGNVSGNGTPSITYDAAALARLNGELGTFARVPGSWRDF